eukprot:Opistho-2@64185
MSASSVSRLFTPVTIRGVTLRNRIGVSPMCQYSAAEDGKANDWHYAHLVARSIGAGIVIVEATGVEPRGRISPGDTGLWEDAQIAPWKRIVDACKANGAKMGIQLAHAGRKASARKPWDGDDHIMTEAEGGWQTVAPSPLPFGDNLGKVPHELTIPEIKQIIAKFVDATVRADKAGFDLVELHAAHGYLLHEFYSPLTNKRTDDYGGSFENRTRLVVETARAMRDVWGSDRPLAVRLSCSDWVDGGWTADDTVRLSARLRAEADVDIVDCSSGFNTPDYRAIPFGPCFQVPFAERVRKEAGVLTAAVGVITTAQEAEDIVASGKADIVLLARAYLRDPHWAYTAAVELNYAGARELLPVQYQRAHVRK